MNVFEKALLNYYSKEELRTIQRIKIGIAGAGGLGSNCALNLVRSGFKKFYIYDYDKVEINNLNRQFYFLDQVGMDKTAALKENLIKINPELEINTKKIMITDKNILKLFEKCDVVVEAFDNAEYKRMIAERYIKSNKLFVSASGLAGIGNSNNIIIKKINDKFYLIGDFNSEVSDTLKPYSPRVSVAAAKQADVILNYIKNKM